MIKGEWWWWWWSSIACRRVLAVLYISAEVVETQQQAFALSALALAFAPTDSVPIDLLGERQVLCGNQPDRIDGKGRKKERVK